MNWIIQRVALAHDGQEKPPRSCCPGSTVQTRAGSSPSNPASHSYRAMCFPSSRLPAAGHVTPVPSSDRFRLVDWQAECLSDSFTINRVGLREVFKLSFDDELRYPLHRRRDVAEQLTGRLSAFTPSR